MDNITAIKSKEEIISDNNIEWCPEVTIQKEDILDAMEEYAKQECIEFRKWIIEHNNEQLRKTSLYEYVNSPDYTSEQLYELYLQSKNK